MTFTIFITTNIPIANTIAITIIIPIIRPPFEPLEFFGIIGLILLSGTVDGESAIFIFDDSIWVEFNNLFVIELKDSFGTECIVLKKFLSSFGLEMIVLIVLIFGLLLLSSSLFIFGTDVFIRDEFIDSNFFILEVIKVVLLIDISEDFLGSKISISSIPDDSNFEEIIDILFIFSYYFFLCIIVELFSFILEKVILVEFIIFLIFESEILSLLISIEL